MILNQNDVAILIIDVQEKLLNAIFNKEIVEKNATKIADLEIALDEFKARIDELVAQIPTHEHTACPTCGKCTAEDCDGVQEDRCAGHEVSPDEPGDDNKPGTSCFGALYLGSTLLLMSLVAILIKRKK